MDNLKLKKVGILLSQSVANYKLGNFENQDIAYKQIVQLCHIYVYFFTVNYFQEEDDAQEFSQFIIKNLSSSIRLYNKTQGDFTSYMNSYIRSGYRMFKSSIIRDRQHSEIIEDAMNKNMEDFCHFDNILPETRNIDYGRFKLSKSESQRVIAFILINARSVDETIIHKISQLTGIEANEMRILLQRAIDADNRLNNKDEKIKKCTELRNKYYSQILKLKRKNLLNALDEKSSAILKKYHKNLSDHQAKIGKLLLVPQYIVAQVLNIDKNIIRSEIYRAKIVLKKIIDKIDINEG